MGFRSIAFCVAACVFAAPLAASAEVLWRGDFETGDLSQWDSLLNPTLGARRNINVVGTPVHGGTSAAEIVIHPDDLWPGNNHNRVELHYDAVEARMAEGQTTFFSFYFRLPAQAQTTDDIAYWETATSFQQSMAFWVRPNGGGTELSFRTNRPSAMTHATRPITIQAWHQLAMQILWSQNASMGQVSVWLDGQRIVDAAAAQTKPDANRLFIQVGYHRNASEAPVETIHVDDALEATTLAEILPAEGDGGAGGSADGGNAGNGGSAAATSGASGEAATSGGSGTGGRATAGGAAGTSSSGAPAGGDTGARGSSAGAAGSAPASQDGNDGCGCRFAGKPTSAGLLALLALGAVLRRRKRA